MVFTPRDGIQIFLTIPGFTESGRNRMAELKEEHEPKWDQDIICNRRFVTSLSRTMSIEVLTFLE
jgi:hypothetical protein